MRKRFKIPLMMITLLLILSVLIGVVSFFYQHVFNETSIVVKDSLSINYLDGQEFSNRSNKTIKFSITNNSNEEEKYYIKLNNIKTNKDIKYKLSKEEEEIKSDLLKSEIILDNISIESNETINYTLEIESIDEDIYSGSLEIAKINNNIKTFSEIILASNEIKDDPITSIGEAAIENEGLIISEDDLGTSYYFRGNVVNNYVYFADHLWRIVKINGDGSVKLVLNDLLDTISSYYYSLPSYNYNESNIKNIVDAWYDQNLSNYSDYISNQKYCNDLSINADGSFGIYKRIMIDHIASYKCLGDKLSLKIALLTIDEVILAGASTKGENGSFYLYNDFENAYYLMSSASKSTYSYYPFLVNANGSISTTTSGTLLRGVRPVVSIIKTVTSTGNGQVDNPYLIVDM